MTLPSSHGRAIYHGGVLSAVDTVVQRRDGPRRLRDHDDDDDDDDNDVESPVKYFSLAQFCTVYSVTSCSNSANMFVRFV